MKCSDRSALGETAVAGGYERKSVKRKKLLARLNASSLLGRVGVAALDRARMVRMVAEHWWNVVVGAMVPSFPCLWVFEKVLLP